MRVLICGDRNWTAREPIRKYVATLNPAADVIIEGEARGADSIAAQMGDRYGVPVHRYPALWNRYGRAAGPMRNRQMLIEGKPDLVVAFHADIVHSKGTRNMVEIARKAGVRVRVVTGQKETD